MTQSVGDEPRTEWHVVKASGEIDLLTAPTLRESLLSAINSGHTRLVVDMSSVTFVDSSGFSVLVGALKRLNAVEGSLRLAGTHAAVRASMRISGIDRILGLYPDVDSARSSADQGSHPVDGPLYA